MMACVCCVSDDHHESVSVDVLRVLPGWSIFSPLHPRSLDRERDPPGEKLHMCVKN